MAARPEDGVVDADHRIFAVPNLYIIDGSVLPTQGAANPALTIMALAARAADRLIRRGRPALTHRAAGGRAMTGTDTPRSTRVDRRGLPRSRPRNRRPTAPCSWDATTAVTVAASHAGGAHRARLDLQRPAAAAR